MNRHIPTQPRAQATRRAILDAAYAMLGELEPDEISTVAVAGRAGVPVGSVYRYYANRTDIFRALAEQAMELVDTPFEDMLLSGASIELMVENAIGLLLANNTVADMRLLRLIRLSPDLVDVWTTSNRRVEAALAAAIQARNPRLPEPVRLAAGLMLSQLVLSGVDLILASDDAEARVYLQRELVGVAVAYLIALMERT